MKTQCPHIVTSDEGTSYCNLAETSVVKLANENVKLKEENGKLKNEISNISTLVFGEYDLGISHYQRDKFWLSNKIGEGMELDKEMIDEMLGDFFKKNF